MNPKKKFKNCPLLKKKIKKKHFFCPLLLTGTFVVYDIGILHKFGIKDMGILNIFLDITQGILYNLIHGNI